MATENTDLSFATIGELSALLRERKLSSVELTRHFADRLETQGLRYNAVALSLRQRALAQAKEVDGDLKRERFRSPLQGIPYGAKDLIGVEDQLTTWGAKPYAAQKSAETATIVRKLDRAGAVLLGKLSMVELAGGGGYRFASASLQGPGINPWKRTHWSGGSSSGPGSAVAAGLVPFAIGSETWGSIITPSAFCGITGLRPSYGLVSRHGAMALSWTMDKIGPMGRSAEDCGLILQAIAGGDNQDPGSAGKSFYYVPQYYQRFRELRVGYAPVDFETWADPEARTALQAGLKALRDVGVNMVETRLPDLPYGPVASMIIAGEAGSIFEPLIASGEVDQLADPVQIAGLRATQDVSARDYLRAMRVRRVMQEEMRKAFTDVDVLLAPARYGVASRLSQPLDAPSTPRPEGTDRGLRDLGAAGNIAGWPALSLPCGLADGLPVALALVSRPFTENSILALGREFQKQTDFHRLRPPV